MDPITQYILDEGYLLSDKTISIDFDKFVSGENNKLLITGLSGSGKSTLCRYLSKKYNAKCFETDYCGRKVDHKYSNFGSENPPMDALKQLFHEGYFKCIRPGMKNNKRQVVEGGIVWQSYLFFPEIRKELNQHSVIIFGSSALKATWGTFQRAKTKHDLLYAIKKTPILYARNFNLLKKLLESFKKLRLKSGGEVKEFKIPKL